MMCYQGENIEVPASEVKAMKESGATCGTCGSQPGCCPTTPVVDGKIDMCLNGHTINVSTNACKGIMNAGGTCGPCAESCVDPTMVTICHEANELEVAASEVSTYSGATIGPCEEEIEQLSEEIAETAESTETSA